jgi:hypothetical protein
MKKETKKSRRNANSNLFLARKALRNATEKIAVRTVSSHQPHHYQHKQ